MKVKFLWFVLPFTFFIFLIVGAMTAAVEQPAGGRLDPWFALKKSEGFQNSIGIGLTYGDFDRGCTCFPVTDEGDVDGNGTPDRADCLNGAGGCPGIACRVAGSGAANRNYCTDTNVPGFGQITFPGDNLVAADGEFYGMFNFMEDMIEKMFSDPASLAILWPTLQGALCGFQTCMTQAGLNLCIDLMDYWGNTSNSRCQCLNETANAWPDGVMLWANRAFAKVWPVLNADGVNTDLKVVVALYSVSSNAIPGDPGVPAFPASDMVNATQYYSSTFGNVGSSEVCVEADICGSCSGCAAVHADAIVVDITMTVRTYQNPFTGENSLLDVCVSQAHIDFKGARMRGNIGGNNADCDLEQGEDGGVSSSMLDIESLLPTSMVVNMVNELLHGNCPKATHFCSDYQAGNYFTGAVGCQGVVDACWRSPDLTGKDVCDACSPCNRTQAGLGGVKCNTVKWGQKRIKSTGIPPIDKWIADTSLQTGEGGCKLGFLPVDLNNVLNPYQPFMINFPGYDPLDYRYGIAQLGGATFDVGAYLNVKQFDAAEKMMKVGVDIAIKPRWGDYWSCIDPLEMGTPQYTNASWVTPRVWTDFPAPSPANPYDMGASISQDFLTEILMGLYATNLFCWDLTKDTLPGMIPSVLGGFDLSFLSELLHVPSFAMLAPGVEAVADPDGYASVHLVPAGSPSVRVGAGTYTYPVEYLEDIQPELSTPTQGGLKGDYYRGISFQLFAGSRIDGCGTACNYLGHGNSGNGINFNWGNNGPEMIDRRNGNFLSYAFAADREGWTLGGNAAWSNTGAAPGRILLTNDLGGQSGSMQAPVNLGSGKYPNSVTYWSARFDFSVEGSATADAGLFNFYYDTLVGNSTPTNGYSIAFDHYWDCPAVVGGAANSGCIRLYSYTAGVATLLNSVSYPFPTPPAATLPIRVDWLGYSNGGKESALILVYMNAADGKGGNLALSYTLGNPIYNQGVCPLCSNFGLAAWTGGASAAQYVDNFSIDERAGAYSAIWNGYLMAPFAGSYTVCTRSDDGARLFLDNVLQISNWDDGGMTAFPGECASLTLTKGFHPLRLEYYENQSGAGIGLYWCTPSANPYGISNNCGVAMTEANTISSTYLYYNGVVAGQKTGTYDFYAKLPSSRFEVWAPLNDGAPGKVTNEPVRLFSLEAYLNIGMDIEYIRGITKNLRYWGWDSGSSGSMKTGTFTDYFQIFAEIHPELVDIKYAADQRLTRSQMQDAIASIFSTIASSYIQAKLDIGLNPNALMVSLGMLLPAAGPDPYSNVGAIIGYIGPLGPDSPAIRETQPPLWADNTAGDNLGVIIDIGANTNLNANFMIPFMSMISLAPEVPTGLASLPRIEAGQAAGPLVVTTIRAPAGVFFEDEIDPLWTRGYALSPLESTAGGLGAKGAEIGFVGRDSRGTDIRGMRYSWRLDGGIWNIPKNTQKAKLPPLLEGKHIFEVMTITPDGWADTEPARLDFTVDTQAPQLRLQNVSRESFLTSENPTFVVEASDFQTQPEKIRIAYRLDGGAIMDNGFSKVINLRQVPALEHKLEIFAQDEAGNLGGLTQEFFVDTTRGGYGCGVLTSGKTSKAGTIAVVIILLSLPFMVVLALKLHYREKKGKAAIK